MPNWAHCTLTVTCDEGDEAKLAAFVEAVKPSEDQLRKVYDSCAEPRPDYKKWLAECMAKQPLSFATLVPEPEGNSHDWYAWRVDHWGTKWDASFSGPFGALVAPGADVELSVETQGSTVTPTVVVYKFDTAWSPPVPFVHRASELFPDLVFVLRFGEMGMEIAGEIKCVAGVIVEETELEVTEVLTPEEMWY